MALCLALGLAVSGAQADPSEWTLLAYLRTSGQLESAAEGYLQQFAEVLSGVGSGGEIQVAAQVEAQEPGVARRLVWREGRWSEERVACGEMDAPGAVSQFLGWGAQVASADRYLLLVLGHGRPPDENGPWPGGMRLSRLGQGLGQEGPKRLDVVFLDCCYAGSVETADVLREGARFMVAPPGLLYAPGMPWGQILASLARRPEMTPRELTVLAVSRARELWSSQPGRTAGLLALDLDRTAGLRAAVAALAEKLRGGLEPALAGLTLARGQASSGDHEDMVDATVLAEALAAVAPEPSVAQAAVGLAEVLRSATVMAWAQGSGGSQTVCGPGLFFPLGLGPGLSRYEGWPTGSLPAVWSPLLREYLEKMAGRAAATRAGRPS